MLHGVSCTMISHKFTDDCGSREKEETRSKKCGNRNGGDEKIIAYKNNNKYISLISIAVKHAVSRIKTNEYCNNNNNIHLYFSPVCVYIKRSMNRKCLKQFPERIFLESI